MIIKCNICGKEIKTIPARVKDGRGKFCSRQCYFAHKRTGLHFINCLTCGEEFNIYPSRIKNGRKFCSIKCKGVWQSQHTKGINSSQWRGGGVAHTCIICGDKFKVELCTSKKGKVKFCSNKCRGAWLSKNKNGKNSQWWKGGKVKIECAICNKIFEVDAYEVKKGIKNSVLNHVMQFGNLGILKATTIHFGKVV